MLTTIVPRAARRAAPVFLLTALGACSSLGGLGSILGGGTGAQPSGQLSGTVQSVDTRSQQIAIQQPNGQGVWVGYDNNTQVVYQNRNYSPTALQNGDQVTASIQDNGNGGYYTNYVQVNQSVQNGGAGMPSSNAQPFQGSVERVNRRNGWFTLNDNNLGTITVVLGNGVSQPDVTRFYSLRRGEFVRFYGYRTNNAQVALQQFY